MNSQIGTRFNVGDKVVIDDEQGTIESVDVRYTVRYGTSILKAINVHENDLEPCVEGI